ncbi:MAG: pentapeptide repeat-containing protein [Planctomycetales bacterium]|nr:pentapeptide repeat-containing protein [Planctomycetales bacterium]
MQPNSDFNEPIDWSNVDPLNSFRNKTFVRADFSGRCLVGVDFSGSTLVDCNFTNSDLCHANFEGADLYRSNFRRTVLYATHFRDCNLTRCDLSESYIYGLRIVDFSNITYTKFTNFRLERLRRSSTISASGAGQSHMKVGDKIVDTSQLPNGSYFVNGYSFSFADLDKYERHMQRSQVYNRLRRLYIANCFSEEARSCLYWERYHRTRSWYRYHTFTGETSSDGDFHGAFARIFQSFASFAYEYLAGYGLRPRAVLRNMIYVYAIYVLITFAIVSAQSDSGILYTSISVTRTGGDISQTSSVIDLTPSNPLKVMYFCAFSMFSLTFQYFSPFGHMVWISSLFAVVGIAFLALLISALFSVLRTD